MKRKVKFPLVLSLALLCLMNACYISFNDPGEDYEPIMEIEPGKISTENILGFGKIIATDGDHVLVSSQQDIHIFKHNSPGIELIQTIGFEGSRSIYSMIVYRSELYFGLPDSDGTGTVYVYSRHGDVWELSQTIRKGRGANTFGCAIDIDGETMVIGASSTWGNCNASDTCDGSVYVYQRREGVWEETHEMQAEQPERSDRFGTCVGIYGDLILVGSPMQPLHLYQFNGDWELLKTEEIHARAIAHSGNNFMVSGDIEIRAFILEADGSLSENAINIYSRRDISYYGEIIEMRDSLAILDRENAGCYLLKYGNRQWNIAKALSPDPGEYCTFQGLAITDRYAIIGGENYKEPMFGFVYFRDL
jgi:hypothetical protein